MKHILVVSLVLRTTSNLEIYKSNKPTGWVGIYKSNKPTGWVGTGEVDGNPFFFLVGTYLTLGAKERILPNWVCLAKQCPKS